jgi:hypothetical protein
MAHWRLETAVALIYILDEVKESPERVSHDTLRITTIYTQNDSGQNCVFIYLHDFQGSSYVGATVPVPTETKTNNPMQSYTVARGE